MSFNLVLFILKLPAEFFILRLGFMFSFILVTSFSLLAFDDLFYFYAGMIVTDLSIELFNEEAILVFWFGLITKCDLSKSLFLWYLWVLAESMSF